MTIITAGNVAARAVGVVESVTFSVKLEVPVAVGMPLITPVAGASVKPVGKAPALIVHENGVVPPETVGV